MKTPRKCIAEEYVGEGDRAITRCGKQFPKIFLTNRFSQYGYDLYKIKNKKQFQKFLFNDEFMNVGSKEEPIEGARNLKEAREKAKKILGLKVV
jgi:hypothetical protein